jgi:hypothetical protein
LSQKVSLFLVVRDSRFAYIMGRYPYRFIHPVGMVIIAQPFKVGRKSAGQRRAGPQSPREAALAIVALIEQPEPEIYTNPALADVALRFCQDVTTL